MAVVNEAVAEVAEEVAEAAVEVAEVSRSLSGRDLTIGLVVGGTVGAGACFLILRKKLETKYNQLAEEEIDEMREHFRARLLVREEKPDLKDLAEKVEDLGYDSPNVAKPEPPKLTDLVEPTAEELESMASEDPEGFDASDSADAEEDEAREVSNVFEDSAKEADDGWDYEHETNMRDLKRPYIIHYDERGEQEGFSEATFVYYTGDDVLCDARDNVIEDKEEVVGEENLTKFGHGSKDKNVVYIRNHKLGVDIEVVRHDADYAEVVHGFVKHSDEPRRRRHHFDDE